MRALGLTLWLALATGAGAATFTRTVYVTAYCNEGTNCTVCCGRWAPANRCASGVAPRRFRTAAANWLPFGSRVTIPGIGERRVEDRTAKRYGARLDIFVGHQKGAHAYAQKLGKRRLTVTVTTP